MNRNEILAKPMINVSEMAHLLGVSRATITVDIRAGKLPCTNIGNRRMIARCDIVAYLGEDRAAEILAVTP